MDQTDSRTAPRWARAAVLLLLLGATLGSALDGIHTHFGATAYTSPGWWRMAWWTPPLFAGSFAIGLLYPLLERRSHRRQAAPVTPGAGRAGLALALFILAYFVSVAPLPWPQVSLLLFGIFAVSFWLCDRSQLGLGIAAAAAVGGPLVEWFLVSQGTFVHLHPGWLGLSGWLPFLYLSAAVAMTTLARWLVAA